jgi:cytochrome c
MRRRIFNACGTAAAILLLCSTSFSQTLFPEDPTRGARLFVTKGCVKCHALKGEGGKVGPDFGKIDLGDTEFELASKMLNHLPLMVAGMTRTRLPRPGLKGEDLIEIAGYLYFIKFFDEPGDPVRGQYLFNEKGCSSCHPLSGRGKDNEPGLDQFPQNISPVYLSEMIWNHGPVMIAQMVKLGMKWPTFEGREMMDLLEYIKTNARGPREAAFLTPGNPREGRQVFKTKGCVKCHAVRGEGGKGAEDLGRRTRFFYKSLTQIASSMWNKGPTVLAKMAQTQTGIPKFTPKEMADLLAYLYFLHFVDETGNPTNGKKIYLDMGCSKCHGLDGKPGEWMQVDLSKYRKEGNPMDLVAGIWNHSPEMEKALRERQTPWTRFKKGELGDLLEFMRNPKK